MSACTPLAAESLREPKMRRGRIGVFASAWRTTNAASKPTATAPKPSVRTEPSPKSDDWTIVYTPSISATVTSTAPTTSTPFSIPIPRSDASRRNESAAVTTPIGTLTKKIQCQLTAWVMSPPARSPIAAPADAMKLKMPNAFASSSGLGKSDTIMARITAELTAPPMPCTKRAAINIGWLKDSPHNTEAPMKMARPMR